MRIRFGFVVGNRFRSAILASLIFRCVLNFYDVGDGLDFYRLGTSIGENYAWGWQWRGSIWGEGQAMLFAIDPIRLLDACHLPNLPFDHQAAMRYLQRAALEAAVPPTSLTGNSCRVLPC